MKADVLFQSSFGKTVGGVSTSVCGEGGQGRNCRAYGFGCLFSFCEKTRGIACVLLGAAGWYMPIDQLRACSESNGGG